MAAGDADLTPAGGSISHFITSQTYKRKCDAGYALAVQSNNWLAFFEDSCDILHQVQKHNQSVNIPGAVTIVKYYSQNFLADDEELEQICAALSMLTAMMKLCNTRYKTECPEWPEIRCKMMKDRVIPYFMASEITPFRFAYQMVDSVLTHNGLEDALAIPGAMEGIISSLKEVHKGFSHTTKKNITNLCKEEKGLNIFFASTRGQELLKYGMNLNHTAKFNVLEITASVAVMSYDHLSVVSNSGLLDSLLQEVWSDDTLCQLAALEILSDLITSDHCLDHLNNAGVLDRLQEHLLTKCTPNSLYSINIPGYLKVFGAVGRSRPELLCERYWGVITAIMQWCAGDDKCLAVIATETITLIASTTLGRRELQTSYPNEMQTLLQQYGQQMSSASSQLVRYLDALVQIFYIDVNENDRSMELEDDIALLERWYSFVFGPDVALLRRFLLPAVDDQRLVVYKFLTAIAHFPWGTKMIICNEALMTFLLAREREYKLECKAQRFMVVKEMLTHRGLIRDTAGQPTINKLVTFHRQGPYYIEPYIEEGPVVVAR